MIYITQANSQQSLKDFLQEYVESTSGEWRGIGIFAQMEMNADKSEWCQKHCPVKFGDKVYKRILETREITLKHIDRQSQFDWERVLRDYAQKETNLK